MHRCHCCRISRRIRLKSSSSQSSGCTIRTQAARINARFQEIDRLHRRHFDQGVCFCFSLQLTLFFVCTLWSINIFSADQMSRHEGSWQTSPVVLSQRFPSFYPSLIFLSMFRVHCARALSLSLSLCRARARSLSLSLSPSLSPSVSLFLSLSLSLSVARSRACSLSLFLSLSLSLSLSLCRSLARSLCLLLAVSLSLFLFLRMFVLLISLLS